MATLHADSHVNNLPAPVQEDDNVTNTDLPVMAGVCDIVITLSFLNLHYVNFGSLHQCTQK